MPDVVIGGEAPPADTTKYPPGTVWMSVVRRAADATGKTVKVNVYSTNMADYIGYNLGSPGWDIPEGGPFTVKVVPTTWEYAPSGGAPGLVLTTDFVLPSVGFWHFEANVGEVQRHVDVQCGTPDATQLGPTWDAEKMYWNTPAGRREREANQMRDIARPTPIIG